MWNPAKAGALGTSGSDIWAVLNGSSSLTTRELQGDGIDDHLAYTTSGGNAFWFLSDHLGSIRTVVDSTGAAVNTYTYDAFGNVTSPSSPSMYAWTGRELDAETGMQYNRARYYDPTTGRWISLDPMGFDAGDSNLYRYVHNSPELGNDPSGCAIVVDRRWQETGLELRLITKTTTRVIIDRKVGELKRVLEPYSMNDPKLVWRITYAATTEESKTTQRFKMRWRLHPRAIDAVITRYNSFNFEDQIKEHRDFIRSYRELRAELVAVGLFFASLGGLQAREIPNWGPKGRVGIASIAGSLIYFVAAGAVQDNIWRHEDDLTQLFNQRDKLVKGFNSRAAYGDHAFQWAGEPIGKPTQGPFQFDNARPITMVFEVGKQPAKGVLPPDPPDSDNPIIVTPTGPKKEFLLVPLDSLPDSIWKEVPKDLNLFAAV
jgi:RHS repeat-associated protein